MWDVYYFSYRREIHHIKHVNHKGDKMETGEIGLLHVEDRQEMIELIDSLISNPPGLNGVDTDKGRVGNKHVDIGWVAGLERLKVLLLESPSVDKLSPSIVVGEHPSPLGFSVDFKGTNEALSFSEPGHIIEEYMYPSPLTDICGRGKPVGFPEKRIVYLQSKINENYIYMPVGNQYQLFAILVYRDTDYYYRGVSDGMAFYSTLDLVRESCPCGDYGRPGHPTDRWCDANLEKYNGILAGN